MAAAVNNANKVPRRILGTLLSSLSAGVVPRLGAPYIAIGRIDEKSALAEYLDRVQEGEGLHRDAAVFLHHLSAHHPSDFDCTGARPCDGLISEKWYK